MLKKGADHSFYFFFKIVICPE